MAGLDNHTRLLCKSHTRLLFILLFFHLFFLLLFFLLFFHLFFLLFVLTMRTQSKRTHNRKRLAEFSNELALAHLKSSTIAGRDLFPMFTSQNRKNYQKGGALFPGLATSDQSPTWHIERPQNCQATKPVACFIILDAASCSKFSHPPSGMKLRCQRLTNPSKNCCSRQLGLQHLQSLRRGGCVLRLLRQTCRRRRGREGREGGRIELRITSSGVVTT